MSKKAYKAISIIAGVIAVIGLLSWIGGIHAVNLGGLCFSGGDLGRRFSDEQKETE